MVIFRRFLICLPEGIHIDPPQIGFVIFKKKVGDPHSALFADARVWSSTNGWFRRHLGPSCCGFHVSFEGRHVVQPLYDPKWEGNSPSKISDFIVGFTTFIVIGLANVDNKIQQMSFFSKAHD